MNNDNSLNEDEIFFNIEDLPYTKIKEISCLVNRKAQFKNSEMSISKHSKKNDEKLNWNKKIVIF